MRAMASQVTSLTIVYSTVYSGADQRKNQSSASLIGHFTWNIRPQWQFQQAPKMCLASNVHTKYYTYFLYLVVLCFHHGIFRLNISFDLANGMLTFCTHQYVVINLDVGHINGCPMMTSSNVDIFRATGLSLQWHHNELDSVSNHQLDDCLLNHSFRHK